MARNAVSNGTRRPCRQGKPPGPTPVVVMAFVARCVADFLEDDAVDDLCELPLASPETREKWGSLVGEVVRATGRSADAHSQRLLSRARTLSREFPSEGGLRLALARAELYLGNILLLAESRHEEALPQFERAIELAGLGTQVAAAAFNNRGIAHSRAPVMFRRLLRSSRLRGTSAGSESAPPRASAYRRPREGRLASSASASASAPESSPRPGQFPPPAGREVREEARPRRSRPPVGGAPAPAVGDAGRLRASAPREEGTQEGRVGRPR